ncbi:hypothetical protein KCU93_g5714, partial [Aureobasidium melanogenum]
MAIIPDVPHVSVDIVVDGRPLPEYLDEDDEDSISPTSTIKYVECVSGSRFAIRTDLTGMEFRHINGGDTVSVEYYLDGQKAGSSVMRFPLRHHSVSTRPSVRYREGGLWKERNFMFADLVTSEDVACTNPRPELRDLGTITVKLYHAILRKKHAAASQRHDSKKLNVGHEAIHEKHLKGQAISHQASLGEAVSIGAISSFSTRHLGDAFAVFSFRYRSRRDLQALCLIPRSPSPIPLEDRPEESLNREELLELLRRQKARQEEQIQIKQELKRERVEDDDSDDELVVISSRPPTRKLKISADANTGVETIDLTDD